MVRPPFRHGSTDVVRGANLQNTHYAFKEISTVQQATSTSLSLSSSCLKNGCPKNCDHVTCLLARCRVVQRVALSTTGGTLSGLHQSLHLLSAWPHSRPPKLPHAWEPRPCWSLSLCAPTFPKIFPRLHLEVSSTQRLERNLWCGNMALATALCRRKRTVLARCVASAAAPAQPPSRRR